MSNYAYTQRKQWIDKNKVRTRLNGQGVYSIYCKEANVVSRKIIIASIIGNISIKMQNINKMGILMGKLYCVIRRLPFTDVVWI